MHPLRCWTCGRSLHAAMAEFPAATRRGVKPAQALDEAHLMRYCCRRFPLSDPSGGAPLAQPTPAPAPSTSATGAEGIGGPLGGSGGGVEGRSETADGVHGIM